MMKDAAFLAIWLLGLAGLIGMVISVVVRLIRRDTTNHDRRFIWHVYDQAKWEDQDPSKRL